MPFQCHLTEDPKLLEHADMVWCKKEKFAKLDWVAADIPIWKNLLEKSLAMPLEQGVRLDT